MASAAIPVHDSLCVRKLTSDQTYEQNIVSVELWNIHLSFLKSWDILETSFTVLYTGVNKELNGLNWTKCECFSLVLPSGDAVDNQYQSARTQPFRTISELIFCWFFEWSRIPPGHCPSLICSERTFLIKVIDVKGFSSGSKGSYRFFHNGPLCGMFNQTVAVSYCDFHGGITQCWELVLWCQWLISYHIQIVRVLYMLLPLGPQGKCCPQAFCTGVARPHNTHKHLRLGRQGKTQYNRAGELVSFGHCTIRWWLLCYYMGWVLSYWLDKQSVKSLF